MPKSLFNINLHLKNLWYGINLHTKGEQVKTACKLHSNEIQV